jgi:hypothetical protein
MAAEARPKTGGHPAPPLLGECLGCQNGRFYSHKICHGMAARVVDGDAGTNGLKRFTTGTAPRRTEVGRAACTHKRAAFTVGYWVRERTSPALFRMSLNDPPRT